MWLEEECQQPVEMAEECLMYERRNWDKTRYEAEEQMKKEEDARPALEEDKTQAQLLIRWVAINQRVKLLLRKKTLFTSSAGL